MNMTRSISVVTGLFYACGLPVLLAACQGEPVVRDESVKQVTTFTVDEPVSGSQRNMPARLAASQRVELSFRVDGKLERLDAREGDFVTAGQVLAVLEQADFKTALQDRKAAFESARVDYDRARSLIVDEAISQNDYDEVRAEFRTSRAAYEQAKVDLGYTVLQAPFNGEVSSRLVQNFEEVKAGQQIFYVTDTSRMDVKFNVPESVMILLKGDADQPSGDSRVHLLLAESPQEPLLLEFKEFSGRADPQTKTYEVTFQVEQPEDGLLLPGMTGSARVELLGLQEGNLMVPSRAVFGDIYMNPRVWVLDTQSNAVSSQPVSVGRNAGRSIAITGGLEPGDVLVSSHMSFLREGEVVEPLDAAGAL
mgnify:CR=1 FL=1